MQELEIQLFYFFNETNNELKLGKGAESRYLRTIKCWPCEENFQANDTVVRDCCQSRKG